VQRVVEVAVDAGRPAFDARGLGVGFATSSSVFGLAAFRPGNSACNGLGTLVGVVSPSNCSTTPRALGSAPPASAAWTSFSVMRSLNTRSRASVMRRH
jgi:hypothetical protein